MLSVKFWRSCCSDPRPGRRSQIKTLLVGVRFRGRDGLGAVPLINSILNPENRDSSSWSCSSRLRQTYVAAKVAGAEPACRKDDQARRSVAKEALVTRLSIKSINRSGRPTIWLRTRSTRRQWAIGARGSLGVLSASVANPFPSATSCQPEFAKTPAGAQTF